MFTDGVQMGAARDHAGLEPGMGQSRGQHATYGAGTDNAKFQRCLLKIGSMLCFSTDQPAVCANRATT